MRIPLALDVEKSYTTYIIERGRRAAMSMYESNKIWDVEPDGSVIPSSLNLESRQPQGRLEKMTSKIGPGTAIGAYTGIGGVLALLWGSHGITGFMGTMIFWLPILGFKIVAAMLWPVLLLGGAGAAGAYWLKNKKPSRLTHD